MSQNTRPAVLFATAMAVALIMALAPGAAGQPTVEGEGPPRVEPVLLHPSEGALVSGPTTFHVRQPHDLGPDGPFVRQLSFFDVFVDQEGQEQRIFIGYDDVGIDPNGWASRCDLWDCSVPGVWTFTYEPDPFLPPGPHRIEVEPFVCPFPEGPLTEECAPTQPPYPAFDVLIDLTPPDLQLQGEDFIRVYDIGTEVALQAFPAPDGDVQLIQWDFQPFSFLFGKGLPRKNQHVEGGTVSGDLDGDGTTGDASCAPTAMGSSLSWFAEHDEDYADLLPVGDSAADKMKKLVEELGEDMDTDDMGSTAAEIKKGTEDYLDSVGLGDDFDVEMLAGASSADVSTEFGRGQDVTLGLRGGGWGHFVAVERVVHNTDGTTTITVMDPWTGGLIPINVAADGTATYKFPWQGAEDAAVQVSMLMIHVSPTADGAAPVNGGGFAGPANTGESVAWDTTGLPPGRYLIRATATDSTGLSQTAYQTIDLVGDGADLETVKTGEVQGEQIEWTVTVTNHGPGDAVDVQVADMLSPDQTVETTSDGCQMVDGVLICDVGTLAEGESATVAVTTRIGPGNPAFTNTAFSGHAGPDSNPTNDGDTASVFLEGGPLEPPPPDPNGGQIAGDDLIDTAIAVSQIRFVELEFAGVGPSADFVVVSRDDDFPDSLAGSVLTGGAPMLFTAGDALDSRTATEIDRVLGGSGTVYLLGGVNALGDSVAGALSGAGYDVERLEGPSRVETALAVADEARRLFGDTGEVMVARDRGPDGNPTAGWADSVTGGGYAADTGHPVIVTPTDGLHPAVDAWLASDEPTTTTLLGGTAALSTAVESAVTGPQRVAGPNRAATAVAVSTGLWEQPSDGARAYLVVNGSDEFGWAHGLAAAGLAADTNAPILLTGNDSNPPETEAAVTGCVDEPVTLTGVGPTTALDPALLTALDALDEDPCT